MAGAGREPLKELLDERMRLFYRTMHQVVAYAIDLIDADHATGKVYTRAEHERGDEWIDMALCYVDRYERRDGTWLFASRSLHPLHVSVLADRPLSAVQGAVLGAEPHAGAGHLAHVVGVLEGHAGRGDRSAHVAPRALSRGFAGLSARPRWLAT